MVEKKLGAEQECGTCGQHIVCRNTTYQGTTKLQWQNDDGTAHYKYDPQKGKSYCPNSHPQLSSEPPQTNKARNTPHDGQTLKDSILSMDSDYSNSITQGEIKAREIISIYAGVLLECERNGIKDPITQGMIMNNVIRRLS